MKIMPHERATTKPPHHIDYWSDEHLACLTPAILATLPGAMVERNVIADRMRLRGMGPREATTRRKNRGGKPGSFAEKCRQAGVPKSTAWHRVNRGVPIDKALGYQVGDSDS